MLQQSSKVISKLFCPYSNEFVRYHPGNEGAYFLLDLQYVDLPADYVEQYGNQIKIAQEQMALLEAGSIANPDEHRRVGHYWLRNPDGAPDIEITHQIRESVERIVWFASQVREGEITGVGGAFRHVILIGIGGSSLGPQLMENACAALNQHITMHFIDNIDPDGMQAIFEKLDASPFGFAQTLVLVASKSGTTQETHDGQVEVAAQFARRGLSFSRHAVAITMVGSKLDMLAEKENWLARFPMWDWVGGRTSLCSAVGLLPAALLGIDVFAMLAGAKEMDSWTSSRQPVEQNPALLLAIAWLHLSRGGRRQMVVLPYKDRLALFSRYLQQLVMESLGKGRDVQGRPMSEGIVVYGNKGSTDQHAYIQQLREGDDRFFACFIEVQKDMIFEPAQDVVKTAAELTSGDYLLGFLLGTRKALYENGRLSLTMTIPTVSPYTVSMLVALYERAVGYYAFMVGINAYHQPGVEAGKQAAASIVKLQQSIVELLDDTPRGVVELSSRALAASREDEVFHIVEHLAVNRRIGRVIVNVEDPFRNQYTRAVR